VTLLLLPIRETDARQLLALLRRIGRRGLTDEEARTAAWGAYVIATGISEASRFHRTALPESAPGSVKEEETKTA
jgi:hypothetical protein